MGQQCDRDERDVSLNETEEELDTNCGMGAVCSVCRRIGHNGAN